MYIMLMKMAMFSLLPSLTPASLVKKELKKRKPNQCCSNLDIIVSIAPSNGLKLLKAKLSRLTKEKYICGFMVSLQDNRQTRD